MRVDGNLIPVLAAPVAVLLLDWLLGVLVGSKKSGFSWQLLPNKFGDIGVVFLALGGGLWFQGLLSGAGADITTGGIAAAAASFTARGLDDIRQKIVLLFAPSVPEKV